MEKVRLKSGKTRNLIEVFLILSLTLASKPVQRYLLWAIYIILNFLVAKIKM